MRPLPGVSNTNRQVLNSWKEISNYIARGVRTAQRWESELSMPVHRLELKDRNEIFAFSDELDSWMSRRFSASEPLAQLNNRISSLSWHMAELTSQTRALQSQLRHSIETRYRQIGSRIRPRAHAPAPRPMGVMLPFRSLSRNSYLR
jgi:predicted  nucleic acid-binding Zn-ribbon protein